MAAMLGCKKNWGRCRDDLARLSGLCFFWGVSGWTPGPLKPGNELFIEGFLLF